MDWLERLWQVGRTSGLSEAEWATALERLAQLGARFGGLGGEAGAPDPQSERLRRGIERNLSDNPMLAAWALAVGARSAEPVWRRFVENFLLRLVAARKPVVEEQRRRLGFAPPVTLVFNPTMRCNLRCRGCYAWNFSQRADMEPGLFVRLLSEARDLGVAFITLTGGEPFLYPGIEDIFERFPELTFMVYTNGQLLSDERVDRLTRLGNVWPAISVEGREAETDDRRGAGVFAGICAAMERMRRAGMLFGISAMPTRKNADLIASDDFLDSFRDRGALFGWLFTYLPVGRSPQPELMATPEQRDMLRRANLRWRRTRPFFMVDFWNDGPLCGGCMSGSRFAFITSDGWAQPCTFVQFATHNLREHSLKDVFASPFFGGIRARQPYHPNLLRPCKIIDHPHVLRELVKEHGARPTCPGAEKVLADPVIREFLDSYSRAYAEIAERAWHGEDYRAGRCVEVPFFGRVDLEDIYRERLENARRQLAPRAGAEDPKPASRPVI